MTSSLAPIHNGAYLRRLTYDPYNPIVEEFEAAGLRTLIEYEADVHPKSVREFYEYFHFTRGFNPNERYREKWVSFYMRNELYEVTMADFNLLMALPTHDGIRFYTNSLEFTRYNLIQAYVDHNHLLETICDPRHVEVCKQTTRVEVSQLKEEVKMAYRVIRENVTCRDMEIQMPGQPEITSVMVIEALVVYWIKHGIKIDMGFIMASIMMDTQESGGLRPKPYGMRLTHLFRAFGFADGQKYSVRRVPLI